MLSRLYSSIYLSTKIISKLNSKKLSVFSNYSNRGYHCTMSSVNDEFILPNNQPVAALECKTAFEALTKKEKMYAHYLSQACWAGSLIVLIQTSPESPIIFTLLMRVFNEEPIEDLKKEVAKELSEDEVTAILVYICGFLANSGNYKSYGDSKFVPNLPVEKFEYFIKSSKAYKKSPKEISTLWEECKKPMYSIYDTVKSLGFPGKGVTTYFSSNYTSHDIQLITNFMKRSHIEGYNTRALKVIDDGVCYYQVLLASIEEGVEKSEKLIDENVVFEVIKGDYSPLLKIVNENLSKAKDYVSTDDEKQMLERYILSFQTGSLDQHKNGSRFWIRNKSPIIETYIGFIENYRDPQGTRGEFEGFVAMVNKEMSKKFSALVENAQTLLNKLPWPEAFEKDTFLKPDFTSLDVLTFGGSGIPCGINIPNYDEIRQNEGFKNVSLGNVIPAAFKDSPFHFISSADRELVIKYAVNAFEVQVGLHELLGHGSGKLFNRDERGEYDFDIDNVFNPLTGEKITSWYEAGDNYDSVFTNLGSPYEECRAECVGLYLSLLPEAVGIFVSNDEEIENIMYVNWLLLLISGIEKALESYSPCSKTWLQAHSQARFVISRLLLEAGEDFITVTEPVENEKLLITMDRNKLQTVGAKAISGFLLKLQVLKSTANRDEAQRMFDYYSEVSDSGKHPWARWRNIVLKHKQPKKIFVQSNTVANNDDVLLKTYEPNPESLIQSWVDRFGNNEYVFNSLVSLAKNDRKHFNY